MKRLVLLIALIVLIAGSAQAQVSGVAMGGDHGKFAGVELAAPNGGFVVRGGVLGRANADLTSHDYNWAAGIAWREYSPTMPVSMDLGFDIEPMAPGLENTDSIDIRGRIGASLHISRRAALFMERSRSLHNGTNYGRWMLGGRIRF